MADTLMMSSWVPTVDLPIDDPPEVRAEPNQAIANHIINIRRKTLPSITVSNMVSRRESLIPGYIALKPRSRRVSSSIDEEDELLNMYKEELKNAGVSDTNREQDDDEIYFGTSRPTTAPGGGKRNKKEEITVDIYKKACR